VALDGAVIVNLNGFVKLVNAVAPKGVWIRTIAVHDDKYPLENGTGDTVLNISAGCQQLKGHYLLAYARSRHQDSDYGRMARQQQVLVALLHQLDPIEILPQVPTLLDIAKDNLTLAVPSADLGSLASLASTVDPDTVQRIGFDPPTYFEFLKAETVSRIQQVVATVFSANPVPAKSSSTSATPHPTATPKPCPPP
jgi:anionic cell wall polymer biosynthesis LytR-Cps2A-Psr (LCP) family protein